MHLMSPKTHEIWECVPGLRVGRHCSISVCGVSPLIDAMGGGPANKEDLVGSLLLSMQLLQGLPCLVGPDERALEAPGWQVLLDGLRWSLSVAQEKILPRNHRRHFTERILLFHRYSQYVFIPGVCGQTWDPNSPQHVAGDGRKNEWTGGEVR